MTSTLPDAFEADAAATPKAAVPAGADRTEVQDGIDQRRRQAEPLRKQADDLVGKELVAERDAEVAEALAINARVKLAEVVGQRVAVEARTTEAQGHIDRATQAGKAATRRLNDAESELLGLEATEGADPARVAALRAAVDDAREAIDLHASEVADARERRSNAIADRNPIDVAEAAAQQELDARAARAQLTRRRADELETGATTARDQADVLDRERRDLEDRLPHAPEPPPVIDTGATIAIEVDGRRRAELAVEGGREAAVDLERQAGAAGTDGAEAVAAAEDRRALAALRAEQAAAARQEAEGVRSRQNDLETRATSAESALEVHRARVAALEAQVESLDAEGDAGGAALARQRIAALEPAGTRLQADATRLTEQVEAGAEQVSALHFRADSFDDDVRQLEREANGRAADATTAASRAEELQARADRAQAEAEAIDDRLDTGAATTIGVRDDVTGATIAIPVDEEIQMPPVDVSGDTPEEAPEIEMPPMDVSGDAPAEIELPPMDMTQDQPEIEMPPMDVSGDLPADEPAEIEMPPMDVSGDS